IFVRSFFDGDGDGIGDLPGLIEKLDYLNDGNPDTRRDLGVQCIWVMPIMPATSYHGYDIEDYYRVDPAFGTNHDFKRFIEEAHQRGIRVILDLVLNHTSNEHPFFKHASRDLGSPYRDWYRWADTEPAERNEWGGTNWRKSSVRDEYFYGFFWHTMPDLNWENVGVREEMEAVATFWLEEMGVDGFRLDAVRHLVEDGGRTMHVSGTHDVLRRFQEHVRSVKPDAFTIGEVWDSTETLLDYYPDQLNAYFSFEISDGIIDAVQTGNASGLLRSVHRMQSAVSANRWGTFLRNHDQVRTLAALGGDVNRAKLAASLLLTLPGIPFIYYGEEIGMTGDKPDPRIRTPMHWSSEPSAGFTDGLPWEPLQSDSGSANVTVLDSDAGSILNHYRRLLLLRAENGAFRSGTFVPLVSNDESVAAYIMYNESQIVLVVANLSEDPLTRPTISSAERILPPGRYLPLSLLGDLELQPLDVSAEGVVPGYVVDARLAPLSAYVVEFSPEHR
ncbi:MAG: alpha-amylase family glycosyl hydrolase, partial [Gemmatimonadota bacterium]|nr:alpha-amylase family glycosyl hydrolase [Gemmatimonadota bacterium]